ncbi:hypothetical protein HC931_17175 [Candidatus Gracilibacteria bacterium]|nr:hypothetical protein [Candidatus Gracilibacteria bacterium]NJM88075.1 hypothetical protein [Hydrococcus sp. RU_2_2]NJP20115.1 hypothetical protein [Hydrococcus sp. CRU_1_1]
MTAFFESIKVNVLLEKQPRDRNPNVAQNIVAIADSQGGLNALYQIISVLPADFPAAIVVVQHLSAKFRSYNAIADCIDLLMSEKAA